jgi:hypothetical protein
MTTLRTRGTSKEEVSLLQPLEEKTQELKQKAEEIKEEVKQEGTRYYLTTLFATGTLFLLNGLLLYFGTLSGSGRIDLARFYGFREGKNEHLQRTVGIMCFILAIVNFFPIVFKKDKYLLWLAAILNIGTFFHYAAETLFFKGLRLEVMISMGMFLVMNTFWTFKEMYQSKRRVVVVERRQVPTAQ